MTDETRCGVCHHVRSPQRECSVVDCPHRKPGTSLHGAEHLPFAHKHDGLGWDRFYRGQRKPPEPGEDLS